MRLSARGFQLREYGAVAFSRQIERAAGSILMPVENGKNYLRKCNR